MTWTYMLTLILLLLNQGPGALAEDRANQVYVVAPTGDVDSKTAEAMAELISVALVREGLQAFTHGNLADQLKEEERKEILKCEEGSRCVEELISSFGFARRLFGKVSLQGDGEFLIVLTLMDKGRVKNKVAKNVECGDADLPSVAAALALETMGFTAGESRRDEGGKPGANERPMPGAAPEAEYLVTFESIPPGALLELDGTAKGETPFSAYLMGGTYRVRMSKASYEAKDGVVVVKRNATQKWELAPAVGWLDIESSPKGLQVRLLKGNRVMQQLTTPASGLALEPGTYVVETAEAAYYVQREAATVKKGTRTGVALTPTAKEGWLKVKAFDESKQPVLADVWVGGTKLGQVPGPWKLKVGKYEIVAKAPGYADGRTTISVEPGQTTDAIVKLARESPSASSKAARIEWVFSKPAGVYFAKTETTVAQYKTCVDAGACNAKYYKTNFDREDCNLGAAERTDHPMNCVTWRGAKEFCDWVEARPPTLKEWVAEASNERTRTYPWGDHAVTCDLAVWREKDSGPSGCGRNGTWPVCSKTAGNSVSGLCDMAGNLTEMTWSPQDSMVATLGGDWTNMVSAYFDVLNWGWLGEDALYPALGFRCVRLRQPSPGMQDGRPEGRDPEVEESTTADVGTGPQPHGSKDGRSPVMMDSRPADGRQAFDGLMAKGDHQRKNGEFAMALSFYLKAAEARPLPEVSYKIAECYRQLGQCDSAVSYCEKAIAVSGFRNAYIGVAKCLASLGKRAEAKEYLREGLRRYDDGLMKMMILELDK
jgi:formylglycine-generating enzyme required for sulfatase activity